MDLKEPVITYAHVPTSCLIIPSPPFAETNHTAKTTTRLVNLQILS